MERPGGKSTQLAAVASPVGFPVAGRPKSDLWRELRWYLEEFLDYPFSPETEHADRVLEAVRAWGEQAFDALFDSREGGKLLDDATLDGYDTLLLQVWSDDARILAWPWEALRDRKKSALAPACGIERHLNTVLDPVAVPTGLPADRVNILLVIARPRMDESAEDPFASVAASLLKAGTRSVVAMSYSLYVSGAQESSSCSYCSGGVHVIRARRRRSRSPRNRTCSPASSGL